MPINNKNLYITEKTLVSPSGDLIVMSGPVITAETQEQAEKYCDKKFPFHKVIGKFIC